MRLKQRQLIVAPVLCADTTVALGRIIYGKPQNANDAERMLGELSGQTHRVLTSIALHSEQQFYEALSSSQVSFEAMTKLQVSAYVATGEPMGKAGAYAVQGRAAAYISRINGSYSGIMGLPLCETSLLLRRAGLNI